MTARPAVGTDRRDGATVVRFPGRSARQRRIRRGLTALLALIVLGVAVWGLFFSPLLALDRVAVKGTVLVDPARVEQRLEPLRGTPLPRIGTGRVAELLEGEPGISDVRSSALLPTGLEVEVTEPRPVARRDGDRGADLLLADGSVLTGIPEDRVAAAAGETPPVTADPDLLGAAPDVRRSAAAVVASLPDALRERVSSVSAEAPELVSLTLEDGVTVLWGDATHPEQKAAVAEPLLRTGADEVDVSVPGRPLTR